MSNEDKLEISNEEVARFIKKIKKGTGKYKGNISIKCFNYGKVGHFASKCPYPKQYESDDEINFKDHKKDKSQYKKKFYNNKNTFYTQEDNSSYEKSEDDESEHLFMSIETQYNSSKKK
jgi:hypothetical protein